MAQQDLRQGAGGYGLLLGCFGFGAIVGAILMPRLRQHLTADGVVIAGTFVFAIATLILAFIHNVPMVLLALLAAGIAWTSMISSLNITTRENIFCRLATGHLLQVFGIPSPLHRDLGGRIIDVMQIVGREID
ncbi:MFS transporter [Nostoc sp.]|uniref:MFS transporter n=1 Tax=Nostoc sp. TaxID=1180 RepID=UPI003FA55221